jgi:PilZ domain
MLAAVSEGDRRGETRRKVSVAASIVRADGKERLSLVRDLSPSGARMLVATRKVTLGETVRLTIHVDTGVEHETTARLLRVEEADAGIWKLEVAVAFDERLPIDVTKVPQAD